MLEIIFQTCLIVVGIVFTVVIVLILIAMAIATIQSIVDNFKRRKIKDTTLKALEENFNEMIKNLDEQDKQKCHEAIDKENN